MTMHTWLAFAGASLILLMIPGPTILLVIGDSLANRGRSSWSTVAGVAAGDFTAMSLSLGGAGALLAASANAFTVLKIVGGCYLVYLGLKSIWSARHAHRAPLATTEKSPSQRFVAAWAVTSLNPKSIVFFVAFVPQFISSEGPFLTQAVIFLVTFVALAALNAAGFGLLARRLAGGLTGAAAQRGIGYAGGAVLMGAGALTLALRSR